MSSRAGNRAPQRAITAGLHPKIVLVVILALVPAAVLAVYTSLAQRRIAVERVNADAVRVAQLAAVSQQAVVESTQQLLAALAELPQMKAGTNHALLHTSFRNLLKLFPACTEFGLIESNGRIASSSSSQAVEADFAGESFFQGDSAQASFAVVGYVPATPERPAGVAFGHRIREADSQAARVLYAVVGLGAFQVMAGRAQLPPGAALTVADAKGVILVHHPQGEAWIGRAVNETPLFRRVTLEREGTAEMVGLDEQVRLYAFAPVVTGPTAPLAVWVGIPQEAAFADLHIAQMWKLAFLGVVAVVAWAGARWYATACILRPVNLLVSAARRLGGGDWTSRTGISYRSGELGQLAQTFDELAQTLQHKEEEAQQAAAELRAAESKFRTLVEQSLVGIYVIQGEKFSYVNPKMAEIFGHSPEEMVSRPLLDLIAEEDRPLVAENVRKRLAGEVPSIHYQLRALRRDGAVIHTEAHGARIEYNGQPAILGALLDITERKRAEEALAAANERLRNTLANMAQGYYALDREWRVVAVNDVTEKHFGKPAAELIGVTFEQATQGRIPDKVREGIKQVMASGQPQRFEVESKVRPGTWALDYVYPRDGGVEVYFTDITERMLAEEALRESEKETRVLNQRLRVLEEAVAQLAAARELEDIMAAARTAGRHLTGADGATFVLRDGDKCFYADEDAIAPLWKGQRFPMEKCISGWVMLNRQPVIIEDIYADPRIPADAYRPTFVKSLAMVPIRTREPLGAIGNYWATTHVLSRDELQLLQALADAVAVAMENVESYKLLEQRVAERTRQLEDTNQELESFSYSVSHDLRAPLRHIQGYVEMLHRATEGSLSEKARRHLKVITDASQEMGMLIDDLLAFSRMGRVEMNETRVPLDTLLKHTVRGLEMATQGREIEWSIAALPEVVGDPSMLKLVFANLLGNAVKYTRPRDRARIEVGCGGKEDGRLIFFVRDNGVGFDMQYAHKLFGVFQRLHRAEEFEGTGIGLATVRRIVARHGGRTWAEGALDQGATLYFTLKPSTS